MAARSRDQSKFPGSGAPVLMVPHHHTKFQKFPCKGVLKVERQRINGRRKKKKKKKIKAASSVAGVQAFQLLSNNICITIWGTSSNQIQELYLLWMLRYTKSRSKVIQKLGRKFWHNAYHYKTETKALALLFCPELYMHIIDEVKTSSKRMPLWCAKCHQTPDLYLLWVLRYMKVGQRSSTNLAGHFDPILITIQQKPNP